MKLAGNDILIQSLIEEGVEYIFGYPGGAALHIYDSIFKQKEMEHILVRHEQGATHAADGYARATGKPGVVLVTSGPGATNAITGIATAFMDSIPMIVISGQVAKHLIGTDAFQETDTDISNRDVSGAKASFAELTEFITRFPDSQYVSYAKQRNIYLRNLIAKSELSAADYYLTIDAHVGAIRRANYVIENIPNSSENYRALKILEESYEALGYTELLEDVRQVLSSNYSGKESNQTSRTREWSWNFLDRPDKKDE